MISVSQTLVYSIMASVPISVMEPETRERMDESSMVPMLSTSLVKRDMISPLDSLSKKRMGSDWSFSNRSLRIFSMAFWETPIISRCWT